MLLSIKNLSVSLGGKELLHGVNLNVADGARQMLAGANGSGKTTLVQTIAGNPEYKVEKGKIIFEGNVGANENSPVNATESRANFHSPLQNITRLSATERALAGIFIGAQNVPEIPGLTMTSFLKHSMTALAAASGRELLAGEFFTQLMAARERLSIPESWMTRSVNVGFSGGERKRLMFMRLLLTRPKLAILDEADSGVDADTQKLFADVIHEMNQSGTAFLIVSHQEKFTQMVMPTAITTLEHGKVVV